MRLWVLLSLIVILNHSCRNTGNIAVRHVGALKEMMHGGNLSSQIKLDTLSDVANLYALRAVENLKGEILILDGNPFISYVKNDSLIVHRSFNYNASLLVFSRVKNWQEIEIPGHIRTYQQIESYIPEAAEIHKINTEQPFPCIIKGKFESAQWHVIDWKEGDKDHSPEEHKSSGLRGTVDKREARVLGFYSDKHRGIFTHHSTNMHLHIKTDDSRIAAHLDDFLLGHNTLLLPAVN